jgi:dUTP pyrophosphatase
MDVTVKVMPLQHFDPTLELPLYQTPGAAGADLRACLGKGERMLIPPGKRLLVPTGLSVEIPHGYELQVRPRSGLSLKTNLLVVNAPGTIDEDYRGEIKVILGNFGDKDEVISHGDRIAQLVLAPVTRVRWQQVSQLGTTDRGEGGFGSTGRGQAN